MTPDAAKHSFQRDILITKAYDLVVCGGGPAGVSHLLGGRTKDNKHWCVGGIFKEVVEALAARGGAINPVDITGEKFSPFGWTGSVSNLTYGVPFDPPS